MRYAVPSPEILVESLCEEARPRLILLTAGLGWCFEAAALAWGDAVLQNTPACDLLLIDELGPLEFRGEGGFSHGLAAAEARRYRWPSSCCGRTAS